MANSTKGVCGYAARDCWDLKNEDPRRRNRHLKKCPIHYLMGRCKHGARCRKITDARHCRAFYHDQTDLKECPDGDACPLLYDETHLRQSTHNITTEILKCLEQAKQTRRNATIAARVSASIDPDEEQEEKDIAPHPLAVATRSIDWDTVISRSGRTDLTDQIRIAAATNPHIIVCCDVTMSMREAIRGVLTALTACAKFTGCFSINVAIVMFCDYETAADRPNVAEYADTLDVSNVVQIIGGTIEHVINSLNTASVNRWGVDVTEAGLSALLIAHIIACLGRGNAGICVISDACQRGYAGCCQAYPYMEQAEAAAIQKILKTPAFDIETNGVLLNGVWEKVVARIHTTSSLVGMISRCPPPPAVAISHVLQVLSMESVRDALLSFIDSVFGGDPENPQHALFKCPLIGWENVDNFRANVLKDAQTLSHLRFAARSYYDRIAQGGMAEMNEHSTFCKQLIDADRANVAVVALFKQSQEGFKLLSEFTSCYPAGPRVLRGSIVIHDSVGMHRIQGGRAIDRDRLRDCYQALTIVNFGDRGYNVAFPLAHLQSEPWMLAGYLGMNAKQHVARTPRDCCLIVCYAVTMYATQQQLKSLFQDMMHDPVMQNEMWWLSEQPIPPHTWFNHQNIPSISDCFTACDPNGVLRRICDVVAAHQVLRRSQTIEFENSSSIVIKIKQLVEERENDVRLQRAFGFPATLLRRLVEYDSVSKAMKKEDGTLYDDCLVSVRTEVCGQSLPEEQQGAENTPKHLMMNQKSIINTQAIEQYIIEKMNIRECRWCCSSLTAGHAKRICDVEKCRATACIDCWKQWFTLEPGSIISSRVVRCIACQTPVTQHVADQITQFNQLGIGVSVDCTSPGIDVVTDRVDQTNDVEGKREESIIATPYQIAICQGMTIGWCEGFDTTRCDRFVQVVRRCDDDAVMIRCTQCVDRHLSTVARRQRESQPLQFVTNRFGFLRIADAQDGVVGELVFRRCPHCQFPGLNRSRVLASDRRHGADGMDAGASGGCWHMTCTECNKHSCWDCSKQHQSREEVRACLNSRHGNGVFGPMTLEEGFYSFDVADAV